MKNYLPKILITGGDGQLAQALKHHSLAKECNLFIPNKNELNILNAAAIKNVLNNFQPDCIINTAAYTQVDKAEQEHHLSLAINHQGVANLAKYANEYKIFLIHLSTDYVFDGKKNIPYLEKDIPNPINYYGFSKLSGENAVSELTERYLILRVSGLFSEYKTNFVKTILRLLTTQNHLRIVNDQISSPTYAGDIAETLYVLIKQQVYKTNHKEIYHFASEETLAWNQFANYIRELAQQYFSNTLPYIQAIPSSEYPTPAARPLFSVLNCEKIFKDYGISKPSFKPGLEKTITTLIKEGL